LILKPEGRAKTGVYNPKRGDGQRRPFSKE